jgi:hypothetical protein
VVQKTTTKEAGAMSIVVAVPQVTGRSTGTGTAAATALAGGMTAIALALLGPSAVMPAPRTVAMRRWRETGTVTASGSSRRWQGAALDGPACLVVVGDDPAIFDAGRARLLDLGAKWAPKGGYSEIAALSAYPGVMLPVSADTVLLADLVDGGSASGPLLVNVRHGTFWSARRPEAGRLRGGPCARGRPRPGRVARCRRRERVDPARLVLPCARQRSSGVRAARPKLADHDRRNRTRVVASRA